MMTTTTEESDAVFSFQEVTLPNDNIICKRFFKKESS